MWKRSRLRWQPRIRVGTRFSPRAGSPLFKIRSRIQACGLSRPRVRPTSALRFCVILIQSLGRAANPDLGATFPQLLNITNQPAIPLNDTDTPPGTSTSLFQPPITDPKALRMQAIANTAGFHFAFIEQGGSSLYPVLALKATSREVLRILLSIGGVEIDHFSLWHDKGANATAQPLAGPNGLTDPETGLTFPDFNNPANQHNAQLSAQDQAAGSQMFQTNLILPEPCEFLSPDLPPVSIIRPTLTQNGGAVATIQAFTADNLFLNQSKAFFQLVMEVAAAADAVQPPGQD